MSEIEDIMTTEVVTVKKQTPIIEVIELLLANNITGLPVVDSHRHLVGLISEKDVLKLLSDPDNDSLTVADFMTENVTAFDVEDNIIAVCESLTNSSFRRVPILKDGKLAGVISRKDLIKYILEPIG